jgi:hypothetical protein
LIAKNKDHLVEHISFLVPVKLEEEWSLPLILAKLPENDLAWVFSRLRVELKVENSQPKNRSISMK